MIILVAALATGGDRPAAAAFREAKRQPSAPMKQQALAAYAELPLAFVANAGQTDARVRYSTQGAGFAVFLTRREAMLALERPATKGKRKEAALGLRFLGANRRVAIRAERPEQGRVNYLLGNDPTKWHTRLRTYERVVYRNLWLGVDMVFHGENGRLKYEFLVRPGARVGEIRLAYRGAKRLSLDSSGNLLVRTPAGVVADKRPLSYQLVNGKRVAVASRFALWKRGAYGFAVGAYDRRYPLVIDPGLRYSTYLGGSRDEGACGIAVDEAGSAYASGGTISTNFPTTAGAFDRRRGGRGFGDAFVVKLNAAGSALVYSTYLGGSGADGACGIAVDGVGSAYVAGSTHSTNFPTSSDAFDRSYNTHADAFVTKLNAAGSSLAYSTYLGGGKRDGSGGIAVDGAGSAYVTGETRSTDFPTSAGAFEMSYRGGGDAFVTKLNAAGSSLAYSTYLGGSGGPRAGRDYGSGIAVDGAGSAYVTGETRSRNFPASADAFDRTYDRWAEAFVTKLNAAGSSLAYSTYLGGNGDDDSYWIAVDGAGSAYVAGETDSRNFPTTVGAFDRSSDQLSGDAFVTKLNQAGSALAYSTFLGGGGIDEGYGVAIDGAGRAYVVGVTDSRSFPTTAGAFDRSFSGGDLDAFVTKLNAAGSALAYSTFLGGSLDDEGYGVAIDGAGRAYVVGVTDSRSFPTTAGAFDRSFSGGEVDAFVTKLDLIAGPVRCWVPLVIGMRLARAKRAIRALDCSVGRIRRVRSKRVGRVVGQSPRPGTVHRRGYRIRLVVGRR
jgi:hypothetical protein